MSLCAGDPARAASEEKTVREICGYETEDLRPAIPALPIGYGDASRFLEGLQGPEAPPDFQGGLPLTYRLGPSPTTVVHLKVSDAMWAWRA